MCDDVEFLLKYLEWFRENKLQEVDVKDLEEIYRELRKTLDMVFDEYCNR